MDNKALKRALQEAMALVDAADVQTLRSRRGPAAAVVEVTSDDDEECPECAAGECAEHMDDDEAEGLAAMLGG